VEQQENCSRGEYKGRLVHGGPASRRLRIYAPFTCFVCVQLCLTGLWPVVTLISEALSAGFADAVSTAIPAHSEAKATPALETCSASAPVSGGLPAGPAESPPGKDAGQQRVPWVRHRQEAAAEQGAPVPPEPLCTLVEKGLTSPRLARLAGDCPICPMRACCQNAEAVEGAADESGAGSYGRRPTF
jgi:hypothetical protein